MTFPGVVLDVLNVGTVTPFRIFDTETFNKWLSCGVFSGKLASDDDTDGRTVVCWRVEANDGGG